MNPDISFALDHHLVPSLSPRSVRVLTIALGALFVANIFDPGGTLGVKYLSFLVAGLSSLWALKYFSLSLRTLTIGLILFLVWPTWSLLFGVARGGDLSVGLSQVTPFLFAWVLALILPAFDSRTPLRIFYSCILLLAVAVIACFALILLLPDSSISQRLLENLTQLSGQEGFFGTGMLGDLELPGIYFRSTLFLVPAFVYYLFVGRMLPAGVLLVAIGVTFSKAGLTIALLFGAFYSLSILFARSDLRRKEGAQVTLHKRFSKFLPFVVVGGIAFLVLLSLPGFSDQIRDAWAGESYTALVRIGHFHSVMNLFLQNPHYLLVGQGTGIPFYSLGESDYVQSFEIDHLNAIRKFGLPWFIGFSAVVFYSAYKLIRKGHVDERAFGFALISSYFAAGTNPVLTSPLFIILITLCYFAQRGQLEMSR
jgi:hypothetical protein